MLVLVLLALGGARIANARAKLERFLEDLLVRSCPANRKLAGGVADVGAVQAGANALAHVHFLGSAGIRTTCAHARAIHEVVGGVGQRLVHMPADVGVKRDHLANGQINLLLSFT